MVRVDAVLLLGFCLGLVRAAAWVSFSPPFSAMALPVRVRLAFSMALALSVAGRLADPSLLDSDIIGLIGVLLAQAFSGAALGFAVHVLFAALAAAGDMIDSLAGFAIGATIDPLTGAGSSPFARLYQLLGVAFLFATGGHLLVVRGFIRSVELGTLELSSLGAFASGLLQLLGVMLLAALEIAIPVLAALFLAEVALGLISRAAPQLNVYVMGFALKTVIALVLASATLTMLGSAAESLVGRAVMSALRAFGA